MESESIIKRERRSLAGRIVSVVGAISLLAASLMPSMAQAAQLTDRKLTLTSSAVSAVTTYAFGFKAGTTGNIGAVKFELCDSPLEQTTCVNSGNSSGVSFTSSSASISGQTGLTGFTAGTGTPAAPTTNTFWITKGTPQAVTSGDAFTVTFQNVRNPSAANVSYYAKITTYSNSNGTTQVDFGGVAVSTANQVTVSANVQESLSFCVYTGANCAAGGSTVNLGTGADNVLSTSSPSGGASYMDAATNASTGYVITYIANDLSSTNDTITAAGGSAGAFSAGTAKFGINLVANTVPTLGGAVSGSGTGVAISPYTTANQVAFVSGSTPQTVANSASGPTLSNKFTVSYIAQAGNTTKAGSYSTTFTWVATGTF